jgi:hypothetical protein
MNCQLEDMYMHLITIPMVPGDLYLFHCCLASYMAFAEVRNFTKKLAFSIIFPVTLSAVF